MHLFLVVFKMLAVDYALVFEVLEEILQILKSFRVRRWLVGLTRRGCVLFDVLSDEIYYLILSAALA